MIRMQQIKMPVKHTAAGLEQKIRRLLRLSPKQGFTYRIWKQSIDARRKNEVSYVYTVDVSIADEKAVVQNLQHIQANATSGHKNHSSHNSYQHRGCSYNLNNKNIMLTTEEKYHYAPSGTHTLPFRPVIVGSGPAGLFCAYRLAQDGYCPIVIERGKRAQEREQDVAAFWKTGVLNPSSNVQFGEGGAGTFSDGKLNTLVKDPAGRNRYVLETFVQCGADSSILYVNKPHIGTDVLVSVVSNLRDEIIRMGGAFYFETCLTDIQVENSRICSITVASGGMTRNIETGLLVLATGHSARDTFEMLYGRNLQMEAKAFAVGFRMEHPQQMIDAHQYKGADMRYLPAASYKVTANFKDIKNHRGVYSFCMCPGGFVVNASSEPSRLAINGMSYQKRDGKNANSAIIVSVTSDDFGDATPLGGIAFQRRLEERAYQLGQGRIPQQLYGDYVAGKISSAYGTFASQTKGACMFADLGPLLQPEMKQCLIRAVERFGGMIPGFNRYDAILSGIESRTSSPVRILRDAQMQSNIQGIYPCGEGAGYAGGIMSAAMDGIKTAEAIAAFYKPLDVNRKHEKYLD